MDILGLANLRVSIYKSTLSFFKNSYIFFWLRENEGRRFRLELVFIYWVGSSMFLEILKHIHINSPAPIQQTVFLLYKEKIRALWKRKCPCGVPNLRRTNWIASLTWPGGTEPGMVVVGFLRHNNQSPTHHRACQHDHIASFQTFFYIGQLLLLTSEKQKHQEGTGWFQITLLS